MQAKSLEIALKMGNGKEHQMLFDLFGEIDTEASKVLLEMHYDYFL